VLDILLGNQVACFSMGEIRKFFDEQGIPSGRTADAAVDFWQQVYAAIPQSQKDLYLIKKYSSREYHLRLVQTFLQCTLAKTSLKDYGLIWDTVFTQVRNFSGKQVLIDSSKYPGRAMLLEATTADMAIVYILRKRSDVVRSFRKRHIEQPRKSVLGANLYYCLNRIACSTVFFLSRKQKIRVDFDRLQASPEDVLQELCLSLGIACDTAVLEKVRNRQPIPTGHIFDGNRIRLNDSVTVGGKK